MKHIIIGFAFALVVALPAAAYEEQTEGASVVWKFTTTVEGLEFSLNVQGDSSSFFEALSIDSLTALVQDVEEFDAGNGGGMRTHVSGGVSVKSIRISCKAANAQDEIRELLQKALTEKLEKDGLSVVGEGKSAGGINTFSIYYEENYRYGGIHCTLVPEDGDSTHLHFLVHESPLLEIGYTPDAEQDMGGNE